MYKNKKKNMNYDKKDQDEILRLYKVGNANQTDMDSIYHLLRKYVRPNAAPYILNCNCQQSISAYYQALLQWYADNNHLFNENPQNQQ